jgi:DNA adenine methylase
METAKVQRPPISYYGGKQKMLQNILPIIPAHTLYCEPFLGGAAVFFGKEPSIIEVLNDTNRELMNFYEVIQNDFISLEREIRITLHSRSMFNDAKVVYHSPHLFSRIKRAWSIWVMATQGFASQLDSSFGYDRTRNQTTKKITNKRESFTEDYAIRLQNVQLESTDAIRVIRSRDSVNSFFYLDPPYVGSDCGHYDGYSQEDFDMLLDQLSKIEGKFLLSSYPNASVERYLKQHGWYQKRFESTVSVANTSKHSKKKTEVLTANYPI